ncbi:MAG: hypothetical protein RLZZ165_770 [Bacteroidota bacterium]|jgi:hypothetical protein
MAGGQAEVWMELIRRMTVQDSQNGPIPAPKTALTALKGMVGRPAATLPGTVSRQAPLNNRHLLSGGHPVRGCCTLCPSESETAPSPSKLLPGWASFAKQDPSSPGWMPACQCISATAPPSRFAGTSGGEASAQGHPGRKRGGGNAPAAHSPLLPRRWPQSARKSFSFLK